MRRCTRPAASSIPPLPGVLVALPLEVVVLPAPAPGACLRTGVGEGRDDDVERRVRGTVSRFREGAPGFGRVLGALGARDPGAAGAADRLQFRAPKGFRCGVEKRSLTLDFFRAVEFCYGVGIGIEIATFCAILARTVHDAAHLEHVPTITAVPLNL